MKIHIFALRWKDEIRRSSQLITLLKLVVVSRTCSVQTVQTSKIERPDPRVTHYDVYHEIDCKQTTKERTQLIKTPLTIAYQSNTMSPGPKKLPKSHTKSSIVDFNQTFI